MTWRRHSCLPRRDSSRRPANTSMRLLFLTSTPLDVRRGSGTFVGIHTLARALRAEGATIDILAPRRHLPVYTLERILYNETLRVPSGRYDATIGFDLDG